VWFILKEKFREEVPTVKLCDTCSTVFKDNIFVTYCESFNNCPLRDCIGNIIEIDENLYEAYKILNEKGYSTRYCCSAHSFKEQPFMYIQFYGNYAFQNLPVGFKFENNIITEDNFRFHTTTITKKFNRDLSSVKLQVRIWKAAQDILKWAEALVCLDSEPEFFCDD
jgi:hypothetical protein